MWIKLIGKHKILVVIFSFILISALIIGCTGHSGGQTSTLPTSAASSPSTNFTAPAGSSLPPASPPATVTVVEKISKDVSSATSYRLDSTISTAKYSNSDKSDEIDSIILSKMELDIAGHKMQMDNSISLKQAAGAGTAYGR